MIKTYKKGDRRSLSLHFWSTDFDCRCKRKECLETLIDQELVKALESLWAKAGEFQIASAFRCILHNEEVKGAQASKHLLGLAADCHSSLGYKGNLMARYAEEIEEFKDGGIGIYPLFVHVDTRPDGPARWSIPMKC